MTTAAGTEVGKRATQEGRAAMDTGRRSQRQTSAAQSYTFSLSSEKGKKQGFHFILQLLTQYFK